MAYLNSLTHVRVMCCIWGESDTVRKFSCIEFIVHLCKKEICKKMYIFFLSWIALFFVTTTTFCQSHMWFYVPAWLLNNYWACKQCVVWFFRCICVMRLCVIFVILCCKRNVCVMKIFDVLPHCPKQTTSLIAPHKTTCVRVCLR